MNNSIRKHQCVADMYQTSCSHQRTSLGRNWVAASWTPSTNIEACARFTVEISSYSVEKWNAESSGLICCMLLKNWTLTPTLIHSLTFSCAWYIDSKMYFIIIMLIKQILLVHHTVSDSHLVKYYGCEWQNLNLNSSVVQIRMFSPNAKSVRFLASFSSNLKLWLFYALVVFDHTASKALTRYTAEITVCV